MKNIIICGAPGSGKGTQSKLLIDKYKLMHLSTGDMLRKEIAENTALGKVAKTYIDKGHLIPDELMINIIENILENLDKENVKGILLDGFPRTLAQAEAFEKMMDKHNEETDLLVGLQVDEDELINRLLLRGKESGRSDDNIDTIKERLEVYKNQTKPISQFYDKKGKLVKVDGTGNIEDIFERISKAIDKKK